LGSKISMGKIVFKVNGSFYTIKCKICNEMEVKVKFFFLKFKIFFVNM
jgi:hypothetical protein